jgi:hypothetical protein
MMNRRSVLKGITLGAGAVALTPFIEHMNMLHAADKMPKLPKRFVFVVKSSGLQAEFINPQGLQHGASDIIDSNLKGKKLSRPKWQDVYLGPQQFLWGLRRL